MGDFDPRGLRFHSADSVVFLHSLRVELGEEARVEADERDVGSS